MYFAILIRKNYIYRILNWRFVAKHFSNSRSRVALFTKPTQYVTRIMGHAALARPCLVSRSLDRNNVKFASQIVLFLVFTQPLVSGSYREWDPRSYRMWDPRSYRSAIVPLVWKDITKQECIPVGCVPPAHWSYLRILSYPTHAPPPRSNHACPLPLGSNLACPPQSNHTPPPGATTHVPPLGASTQNHRRLWKYNLAPTSLRAVIMQTLAFGILRCWTKLYLKT